MRYNKGMPKKNRYEPGNPEYDFWNDKNLYPDLRNDYDKMPSQAKPYTDPDNTKIGFGSVFVAVFVWIFIFAPFALFFTWKDGIVQVLFWGGIAIIVLMYIAAFYNAIQERKRKG